MLFIQRQLSQQYIACAQSPHFIVLCAGKSHYPPCCASAHSQNETVNAVGECVWAHYLTVTEDAGRGGVRSLSAAQQQELWVQYSALQIALQVCSHFQAPVFICGWKSSGSHSPSLCLSSFSSGLSSKSGETPKWHFHLGTITHTSVPHLLFPGTVSDDRFQMSSPFPSAPDPRPFHASLLG